MKLINEVLDIIVNKILLNKYHAKPEWEEQQREQLIKIVIILHIQEFIMELELLNLQGLENKDIIVRINLLLAIKFHVQLKLTLRKQMQQPLLTVLHAMQAFIVH